MSTVRKHWRLISLQGAMLLVCCAAIIAAAWGDGAARAQGSAEAALDPVLLQRVDDVREHLALTAMDMAAMGVGRDQAVMVLGDLRSWVESNLQAIERSEQAVLEAQRQLRQTQQSIRVGPRDEQQIRRVPTLISEVATANQAKAALLDSAANAVATRLSAEQSAVWQTARANTGVPLRYRYAPGLRSDEKAAITDALARRQTDKSRSRFSDADAKLGANQREAVAAARTNQLLLIDQIRLAEMEVLPREVEPVFHQDVETPGTPPER